jgi:hypothetical protein
MSKFSVYGRAGCYSIARQKANGAGPVESEEAIYIDAAQAGMSDAESLDFAVKISNFMNDYEDAKMKVLKNMSLSNK